MSLDNKKPHRYFFNHKGIKGHASFVGKPSKEVEDAVFKMAELAHKNIKPPTVMEANNEWISVEERLPENISTVLCLNDYGAMWVLWYDHAKRDWVFRATYYSEYSSRPITHWQPLPKPPQSSIKPISNE